MTLPEIVTREEWHAAHAAFVVREKEATRARDALSAARRALPMVELEKDYVLEGPAGPARLVDLFEGRRQLIVYHFMFAPEWEQGCPACSFLVDHVPHQAHLHQRDTTFAVVSRAPQAALQAYRERMGWDVSWYSAGDGDFAYDFHATLDERVAPVEYNFEDADALAARGFPAPQGLDAPKISVFLRDGDRVFHTYSSYARGTETMLSTFHLLDLTALGRQEEWEQPADRYAGPEAPIMRHDEY